MEKIRNETIIFGIIAVIIVLALLFGSTGMMGYRFGYGMMGYYGGFYSFGWIIMLLIIVALVLLIFWLMKQIRFNKKYIK